MPDSPAPSRIDAAHRQAASARLALANRRGATRLSGIAHDGRCAGRLAQTLPALPAGLDPAAPWLTPILSPATGARIFAAAAAALCGHRLALTVSADARISADALVTAEARRFALQHRYLSLPLDETPLADALAAAGAQVRALWAAGLPAPLDREFGGSAPPEPPVNPATPTPRRRRVRLVPRWRRPGRQVARNPQALASAERPLAALRTALDWIAAEQAGEVRT